MRELGRREGVIGRIRRSGRQVIRAENAVHSVLYLVRAFVNGSVRIRRLGIEFRGLVFVVVYVGAIAVLFRFVVMMLNRSGGEVGKAKEEEEGGRRVGGRRVGRRGGVRRREEKTREVWREKVEWERRREDRGGMKGLGQVRYTYGREYVRRAGLVRRVGRVGARVLTLQVRRRGRPKRQKVSEQRGRIGKDAVRREK